MKLEDIGFLEVIDSRAENISPDKISYCEWIITSRCNFNCPYCNRLTTKDLDMDTVRSYLDTLKSMYCKYIHITGGEPTCRRDLVDIVDEIRSRGIRVGLSSNGSKPFEYYNNLINHGVEYFSVSLDIHQRDLNKKFTMIEDNVFDIVVKNIREIAKLAYITVGVVFTDDNINYYNEILNFISGLGANDIRVMTATKYDKILEFNVSEELLNKHPILKFRINNFNDGKNMRGSDLSSTNKCYLVKDDLTILGEDYYPCAVYARERGKPIGKFSANNIKERHEWFEQHDAHTDPICKKYCMDFKCRFNDKVHTILK
jgi:MoaA/NifB/PqqE/SkfB family radical SAM enzyme